MSCMSIDEEEMRCIRDQISFELLEYLPDYEISLEKLMYIPFKYVQDEFRIKLAELLQPPEGRHWKSLACAIKLEPDTIRGIEHANTPRSHMGLYAMRIFEEFDKWSGGSVGQMLLEIALLERRDVSQKLINFIPSILQYYESLTKVKEPTTKQEHHQHEKCLQPAKPKRKKAHRIRLYITFCKRSVQEALNIYEWLQKKQFAIALDDHQSFDPKTVEERFKRVKYVLVCVTPEYYDEILESSSSAALADPKTPTQLMYRLMLHSFQNTNGCNTRFIPLCCQGATVNHIPHFLREKNGSKIRIYHYPEEHDKLFYFLKDPINVVDQHIKKKLEEEGGSKREVKIVK